MNERSKRCKICMCRSRHSFSSLPETRRFSQQDKENKVCGQVSGCKSPRDFACPNSKTRLRDPLTSGLLRLADFLAALHAIY